MGHTNNSSIHKTSRASVPSGKWRWYLQNLALTISNLQCTCGVKPRYPSLVTARAHSLPPLSGFHLLPLSLSLRITDTNACCPTGLSHCLSNHEDTVVLLTCLCWKKSSGLCLFTNTDPLHSQSFYRIRNRKFHFWRRLCHSHGILCLS